MVNISIQSSFTATFINLVINLVGVKSGSGSPQNWNVVSKSIDVDEKLMQVGVKSLWAIGMKCFEVGTVKLIES